MQGHPAFQRRAGDIVLAPGVAMPREISISLTGFVAMSRKSRFHLVFVRHYSALSTTSIATTVLSRVLRNAAPRCYSTEREVYRHAVFSKFFTANVSIKGLQTGKNSEYYGLQIPEIFTASNRL